MAGLDDLFGFLGKVEKYKQNKSQSNARKVWNAYSRQVDVRALDDLKEKLAADLLTYGDRYASADERSGLLWQRARTARARARFMEGGIDRNYQHARRLIRSEYQVADAQLWGEAAALDREGIAIASARGVVGAERAALMRETGARGDELYALTSQLMIERGVFNELQGQRFRVNTKMGELVALEADAFNTTFEAQLESFAARYDALETMEWALGVNDALARTEIEENAALTAGKADVMAAARFGGGSAAITGRRAVERGRARALTRLGAETAQRGAEIRTRYAGLAAERIGALTGADVQRARFGLRAMQVETEAIGLGTEARQFGARQAVQAAGIRRGRAEAEGRYETGTARLAGQEADLGGRQAELVQRRQGLTARRGQLEARQEAGEFQIEQQREESRIKYTEQLGQALQMEQEGREQDRKREEVDRDRSAAFRARRMAVWQREKLNDLPLEESDRSSLGLLLTLATDNV